MSRANLDEVNDFVIDEERTLSLENFKRFIESYPKEDIYSSTPNIRLIVPLQQLCVYFNITREQLQDWMILFGCAYLIEKAIEPKVSKKQKKKE